MIGSTVECRQARHADQFLVEDLPNELLIYDLASKKAHCLNSSAAAVFRLCDGTNSPAQIASALQQSVAFVELAIAELDRAHLLVPTLSVPHIADQSPIDSRRRALKKMLFIAGAVVAIPMVRSIIAPSVAEAASCLPAGQVCIFDPDCCSGRCIGHVCSN